LVTDAARDIYCNGRTYAEHCAWLVSLVGDEFRTVYMPIGYLFDFAVASYWKRRLLATNINAGERLEYLDGLSECVSGPVTAEAIAAIEPICSRGEQILSEVLSLPVEKQTQAFSKGDVFRILARLNPSLLAALRLCALYGVPERPRNSTAELCQ
jgi:hypothetical protein